MEYDFLTGEVLFIHVQKGRECDVAFAQNTVESIKYNELAIRDLGYHSLDVFRLSQLSSRVK
ncbi:hypothetical protein EBO34_01415 [Alteribacter keqinensis]|uniref:Transposase IS4-like domain-containing protein n=2 Tax=Alteribacter keqinensis TaxID=2483800 RepID=A0A3M7TV85_9BACI|nr:hypothetical protein EBO34_01415 [Alteribacter keqinensis]